MTDCGHLALIASGEARGLCPLCQQAEIERLTALLKRHDDLCRKDEAVGLDRGWTPALCELVKDTRAALKDTKP